MFKYVILIDVDYISLSSIAITRYQGCVVRKVVYRLTFLEAENPGLGNPIFWFLNRASKLIVSRAGEICEDHLLSKEIMNSVAHN